MLIAKAACYWIGPDTVFVRPGDVSHCMFAVVHGRVEVHTSHGKTLHFGPGNVLGLSTDLAKPELDFHARTLTDTKIIGRDGITITTPYPQTLASAENGMNSMSAISS